MCFSLDSGRVWRLVSKSADARHDEHRDIGEIELELEMRLTRVEDSPFCGGVGKQTWSAWVWECSGLRL